MFRDRATNPFFYFKQIRVCADYVLCEIRFVITPDEACVDKRFRKLTCMNKNVHNFFQSLKKRPKLRYVSQNRIT